MKFILTCLLIGLSAPTICSAQMPPTLGLATVGIKVANVIGKPGDLIGLYRHGASDAAFVDWAYVACNAKSCTNIGTKSGTTVTVQLKVPANAGLTDVRYMTLGADRKYHVAAQIDPDLSPH